MMSRDSFFSECFQDYIRSPENGKYTDLQSPVFDLLNVWCTFRIWEQVESREYGPLSA